MSVVHMAYRGALIFGAVGSAVIGQVFKHGLRFPVIHLHPDKYQVALAFAGALIALGAAGIRQAVEETVSHPAARQEPLPDAMPMPGAETG
jgi:hypothetical protein